MILTAEQLVPKARMDIRNKSIKIKIIKNNKKDIIIYAL